MGKLDGKVAIVTGGGSGIGKAIAIAYAAEGAKVVVTGRRADVLQAAIAEISDDAMAVPGDVTNEQDVIDLFRTVKEKHGRIDVVVCNAGTNARYPTVELPLSEWHKVIETNLTGPFLCGREALRSMEGQGSGRIINIGSVTAKVPRANAAAYGAAKWGLEGLTRQMAIDAREHNIAVSVLQPGNTWSELKIGREEQQHREGIMEAADVAAVAVAMAALPDGVNMLEGVIMPIRMPLVGRG